MKQHALVCILGATGVIACSQGMSGEEIRQMGRIDLMDAGAPKNVFEPKASEQISTCLDLGRKRLGKKTSVRADLFTFNLANVTCGDCRISLSIPLMEQGMLFDRDQETKTISLMTELRIGRLYGHLTIHEPNDTVLEEIKSLCDTWGKSPRYASVCEWKQKDETTWQSAMFAVTLQDGDPEILVNELTKPLTKDDVYRGQFDTFPFFGTPTIFPIEKHRFELQAYVAIATIPFKTFSGTAQFVPMVVEAIRPADGYLLGCLPIKA